jgi:hypothetical protein
MEEQRSGNNAISRSHDAQTAIASPNIDRCSLIPPRTGNQNGPQRRSPGHLPEVRYLTAKSDTRIVAPACLTDTIHSQGFSPSQQFDPHVPLRLYFTPHPLIGFRPSELFPPKPAAAPRGTTCSRAIGDCSLLLSGARQHNPPTDEPYAPLASELYSSPVFDTSRDGKPPFEAAALLALLLSEVRRSCG